jgi:nucleoside-diphosphate-sugar epimerase
MRVFVTGASGYIGSAVAKELHLGGHEVLGLARTDASASALTAAGVAVHRGKLDDLESLRTGARECDGVIHLAFNNIGLRTDFEEACRQDLLATEALGEELEGTSRPFVNTSGTLMLSMLGRLGTEGDVLDGALPRVGAENATIALAQRGVRSSVIRLAPSVHGEGDLHGFVPTLISIARNQGFSAYVGDGMNRWPGVHRLDAARLYRLALEAAPAGTRLHGAAEQGVPFKDIAAAIGHHLDLPVRSVAADDAGEHFGFLSWAVSFDNPTSSTLTRSLLDWDPTHPSLLDDLNQGFYFDDTPR